MNIAIYGIYGTYNFGCEAIVRGSVKFINDVFPDANIKYFSYSYDYDSKALSDLDIEIIPISEKKTFIKRCINKLYTICKAEKRIFYFNIEKMLSNIDIVLSIGGDIYTIPSYLRNNPPYMYYNSLVDFCSKSNRTVVVYGASVGPWGDYKKAVNYFCNNLKQYKLILCREQSSISYLRELNFNNILFFPDPAFQLGNGENYNGNYIGINLSPLSINEVYGVEGDKYIERLSNVIDNVYEEFHSPIIFLPHVISPDKNDNDLIFLQKIKENMKYKSDVTIADTGKGFLGVKDYIKKCRIVVSARMHCAINALEENVPTILLSYSQKSIGMSEYVYGSTKWAIDIKRVESDLIPLLKELNIQHDQIETYLHNRNNEISLEYYQNLEKVKDIMIS